MVKDMVTGEEWTPDVDFVRDMYNLGRYTDDSGGGWREPTTSQGERESEFNRWLSRQLIEAHFRGAEAMAEQVEEDYGIKVKPEFAVQSIEHQDGIDYAEWRANHGAR